MANKKPEPKGKNGANIVYALTNPAMPDLVKIGKTTRRDPQSRIKELSSTSSVPAAFECAMAIDLTHKRAGPVEKALHTAFAPYRAPQGEFFNIEPRQVVAILEILEGKDVTPSLDKEFSSLDKEFSKERAAVLEFYKMNIDDGEVLELAQDNNVQVTVAGNKTVRLEGKEMSLSKATRIVRGLGKKSSPKPRHYWEHKGVLLKNIPQDDS